MAKLTFDLQDGSPVQEFDVTLPIATQIPVAVEATEIDIILTDGSTKKFVPAA